MNYNTQYQDLINKLIQSKPKPTIDPLTLALLTFGDKVNQTTSMPQTNRLGSGLNEAFKTFGEETNKQNTSLRLWDAQNVDFLRAVLTDETAKAKAMAEAEQRTLENSIKISTEQRAIDEVTAKKELEGKNRRGALSIRGIETGHGNTPITYNEEDNKFGIATESPEFANKILEEYAKSQYKEPTKYAPHAPSDFTTYLPEEMRKSLEEEAANVGIKIGKKRISIAAAKTIAEAIKRKTEMDEVKIITGIDPITQQPYERRETKEKIKRGRPDPSKELGNAFDKWKQKVGM